jgi:hypothetical protein
LTRIKACAPGCVEAERAFLPGPSVPHPQPSLLSAHRVPVGAVAPVLVLALHLAACSPPSVVKVPLSQVEAEPPVLDVGRGRLLYDTHCLSCHNREVHWRDRSIVGSWSDLVAQVVRWQNNAGQHWATSEVGDVAAYLNALYYRMPCPVIGCSGASTARDDAPPERHRNRGG